MISRKISSRFALLCVGWISDFIGFMTTSSGWLCWYWGNVWLPYCWLNYHKNRGKLVCFLPKRNTIECETCARSFGYSPMIYSMSSCDDITIEEQTPAKQPAPFMLTAYFFCLKECRLKLLWYLRHTAALLATYTLNSINPSGLANAYSMQGVIKARIKFSWFRKTVSYKNI